MPPPFSTSYGISTNTTSLDITTFLTGTTANPTPNLASSYARFQKLGNKVQIEFKYTFASTITTGNIKITLPFLINATYTKPQGLCQIRYSGTGTGAVYTMYFNENTTSSIAIAAQLTFGGIPQSFTNLVPAAGLGIDDILSGVIIYET